MNSAFSGDIKIFACNANKELARQIAKELGLPLGKAEVTRFADGEICMRINEMVRGSDVYIVQPTSPPVNEHIMELLVMIDAMRRSSAGRITAVMPYYGYARQDRKARARDPISAKLVADLITTAGCNRVLTMDLHCEQIQGFFNIPVDHLRGIPIFAYYYRNKFLNDKNVIAVSPDLGSVARAREFAEKLQMPLAIVDKRRQQANMSEVMNIIGNVEGMKVILVDDLIDTAGTLVNAAYALKSKGAEEVYACCSHAVLSDPAIELIEKSCIKELLILDSIALSERKSIPKIKVASIAPLFANAINRIHEGLSISKLFD